MTTATRVTKRESPKDEALADLRAAVKKQADLADRLRNQEAYIDSTIRRARAAGATWQSMADICGVSDVWVMKRARRPALAA